MQIPPTSAAVLAAGIVSQASHKERSAVAADAPVPTVAQVEQSGTSDPDRDAQGQGDGLHREGSAPPGEDQLDLSDQPRSGAVAGSVHRPAEPPSQLDVLA